MTLYEQELYRNSNFCAQRNAYDNKNGGRGYSIRESVYGGYECRYANGASVIFRDYNAAARSIRNSIHR